MSFQGINFANQRLLPSDDGRLYQNIFNDGALYGCGITYSGTKLTIAQGHLVIGGRQIEIESAEVLDVNQAVSGFAQIVLAIDLTKTATISTFNQISIEVRYAAAADGFSTLTQTDINGAGSYYEAQLALLSLGAGGITGIVQDMPQAAFKGAAEGGGLNLHVVGGTTQPTNPAENTVWVDTDTEINGYVFASTEPLSPAGGMVWFKTGTDAAAAINVDKKNTVMLYPTACSQYVDGAWVDKTAETYLGGAWVGWYVYLLKLGWQDAALGGWNQYGNYGTATFGSEGLVLTHNNGQGKFVVSKNQIDVSEYKRLCFDVDITEYVGYGDGLVVGISSGNQWDGNFTASIKHTGIGTYTLEVDISSVDSGYVKINNGGVAATISRIYVY